MAVKTLLLLFTFFTSSAAALYVPMVGIMAYVMHYHIWPEDRWWGKAISGWGLRYSFTIAVCLGIGVLLRHHALKWRGRMMMGGDWLIVGIGCLAGFSVVAGVTWSDGSYEQELQAAVTEKLFKVLIFCLLLTHVVTTRRRLDALLWTMIVATSYVGYLAWDAPSWRFNQSRLDGIGGPDFRESSFLAAHFAMMLPLIGVQFLRCAWFGKSVCLVAGALASNGLILTRTRAAVIALGIGVLVAAFLAVRGRRLKIWAGLAIAGLAALVLTDAGFRDRIRTIETNPSQMDVSSLARLTIWKAAGEMWTEHPLGVGVGNFQSMIGSYNENVRRRDAHNTFVRCLSEWGPLGLLGLVSLFLYGLSTLWRTRQMVRPTPGGEDLRLFAYGLTVSLGIMLTTSMFMTQLYIEEFWWLLVLPLCLRRAILNEPSHFLAAEPSPTVRRLLAARLPRVSPDDEIWRPVGAV